MAEAPGQWCKHRVAAALLKRTQASLARAIPPVTDLPPIEEPAPVEIDLRFITYLHGRPFVKYAGLLAKAHEAGLVKLDARLEFHTPCCISRRSWCRHGPRRKHRRHIQQR